MAVLDHPPPVLATHQDRFVPAVLQQVDDGLAVDRGLGRQELRDGHELDWIRLAARVITQGR